MRPVATVVIVLEAGTPRFGIWCRACMLPSGAEVDIWSLRPTGLVRMGTARRCLDCGSAEHIEAAG